MKITYFGHSACSINTGEHTLVIDPFLSGNPHCPIKPENIACDYIILTHGHGDHLGDAIPMSQANQAPIIAIYELASYCESKGAQVQGMGLGGAGVFPFGKIKFTLAHHSSSVVDDAGRVHYVGNPAGVILEVGGKTIYHAGDTALFLDMKLIGEMHAIDLAFLPIGDWFTMGVEGAAKAVEFLRPKQVIPIHYNTFPPIEVDPERFSALVEPLGVSCSIMKPGEAINL